MSCNQLTYAVTQAVCVDMRRNAFTFPGFPRINTHHQSDGSYIVDFSADKLHSSIVLDAKKAERAIKRWCCGYKVELPFVLEIQEGIKALERQIYQVS